MHRHTTWSTCGLCLLILAAAGCQQATVLRHGARLEPGQAARLEFTPPADGEILLRNRGPGSVAIRIESESGGDPTQLTLDATGMYNVTMSALAEVHMRSGMPEHVVVDYAVRIDNPQNTRVRLEYLDAKE